MELRFSDGEQGVETSVTMPSERLFTIRATEIRQERTGSHALVALFLDTGIHESLLCYDNFNIGRHEDRVRLARAGHKSLGADLGEAYSEGVLRQTVDNFCLALVDFWQGRFQPDYYNGMVETPPPTFALTPYIIEGGGTIMFGPPGSGKSYLAIAMALSVTHELQYLWECAATKSLYINLERSGHSLEWRVQTVARALGLNPEDGLDVLNARGESLSTLEQTLRRLVREREYAIFFLDSISRTATESLNNDTTANRIINMMNNLIPTWLGIAHSPRDDASHAFGSIHFDAGADMTLRVSGQERENHLGVALKIIKTNDTSKPKVECIELIFEKHQGISKLVDIQKSRIDKYPELLEGIKLSRMERIESYMRDQERATVADISKATGIDQADVSKLVHTERFYRHPKKEGRSVYYSITGAEKGEAIIGGLYDTTNDDLIIGGP